MWWIGSVVKRIITIFLLSFFILFSTAIFHHALAARQETWKPKKPMTFVVHAYGGAYDWTARQIARVLPDYLGQKVIVQGVTGAEGRNALDTIQRSKPDGCMMGLLGVSTYVSLAVTSRYSWDVKDIPVIMAIDTPPYAVFTGPKSPFSSYEDILKMKKVVRIAVGATNFSIIPLILDFEKKGIQYSVARFKGSADASMAVIAGNADLTTAALSGENTNRIPSGDYRALWIYDTKRFHLTPNVPTHVELGMPKEWAKYRSCRLIQTAPGTPEQIQTGLKTGLIKALRDKRTVEWSKKLDTPTDALRDGEPMERIRFLIEGFKQNMKIVETYF